MKKQNSNHAAAETTAARIATAELILEIAEAKAAEGDYGWSCVSETQDVDDIVSTMIDEGLDTREAAVAYYVEGAQLQNEIAAERMADANAHADEAGVARPWNPTDDDAEPESDLITTVRSVARLCGVVSFSYVADGVFLASFDSVVKRNQLLGMLYGFGFTTVAYDADGELPAPRPGQYRPTETRNADGTCRTAHLAINLLTQAEWK